MSFLSGFAHFIVNIPSEIESFFRRAEPAIQTDIQEAQTFISDAIDGAKVLNETSAVNFLEGLQTGLTATSAAVTGLADASTLAGEASTLTNLTNTLVGSGAIGIKDQTVKTKVATAVGKVSSVIAALQTGAVTAPTDPAPAAPVA